MKKELQSLREEIKVMASQIQKKLKSETYKVNIGGCYGTFSVGCEKLNNKFTSQASNPRKLKVKTNIFQ